MGLGFVGENLAKKFLIEKGYKILQQNYHSRFGEIDIIAKEGDCTVFVEVKARSNNLFGTPLEAITQKKLFKIIKTMEFYLFENKIQEKSYRIDAIEVIFKNGEVTIEQVKNISF